MKKEVINTKNAPGAIGPYSQGIIVGDFVYTSGQIPINPATGVMETDIKNATKQSMENVKAILEAAGTSLEKVIKTSIFLKDLNDFAVVNEIYGTYFSENPPARSCVQVAKLPKDAVIEIEAIATK
ncbi:RidA family protein [Clostridium sp.]|uniref:RidA family protein n=1 Tax=Clostridium sp. TaxID=1506 RepID=UPI0025E0A677|nr:RidA family protein [uncultured Clostridium sp.]MDU4883209.1 RidA family protein [Clostridium celatum]MDU7076939.1 RidA family protein [Clostridium celatum]